MDECMTGVLVDISVNGMSENSNEKINNGCMSLPSRFSSSDDDVFLIRSMQNNNVEIEKPIKVGPSPLCGRLVEFDSSHDSFDKKCSSINEKKSNSNLQQHLKQIDDRLSDEVSGDSILDLNDLDLSGSFLKCESSPSKTDKSSPKPCPQSQEAEHESVKPITTNPCNQISSRFKKSTFITPKSPFVTQTVPKNTSRLRKLPFANEENKENIGSNVGQEVEDGIPSPLHRSGTFKLKKSEISPALKNLKTVERKVVSVTTPQKQKTIKAPSGDARSMHKPSVVKKYSKENYKQVTSKISGAWKNSSLNRSKDLKLARPGVSTSFNSSKNNSSFKSDKSSTGAIPSRPSRLTNSKGSSNLGSTVNSSINSSFGGSYSNDVFATSKDSFHLKLNPKRAISLASRTRLSSNNSKIGDRPPGSRTLSASTASKVGPMKAFTPVGKMVKVQSGMPSRIQTPSRSQNESRLRSIPTPSSTSEFKLTDPLAVSTPNIPNGSLRYRMRDKTSSDGSSISSPSIRYNKRIPSPSTTYSSPISTSTNNSSGISKLRKMSYRQL